MREAGFKLLQFKLEYINNMRIDFFRGITDGKNQKGSKPCVRDWSPCREKVLRYPTTLEKVAVEGVRLNGKLLSFDFFFAATSATLSSYYFDPADDKDRKTCAFTVMADRLSSRSEHRESILLSTRFVDVVASACAAWQTVSTTATKLSEKTPSDCQM